MVIFVNKCEVRTFTKQLIAYKIYNYHLQAKLHSFSNFVSKIFIRKTCLSFPTHSTHHPLNVMSKPQDTNARAFSAEK